MASNNKYVFFEEILFKHFQQEIAVNKVISKSGGCISNAAKLETSEGTFFIKWNSNFPLQMFESEAGGLTILRKTTSIKVPAVIGWGEADNTCYILMENLEPARKISNYSEHLAISLADMHRHQGERYGLGFNNYMGSLEQFNECNDNWVTFFIEKRLQIQLNIAIREGLVSASFVRKFDNFYKRLPSLLVAEPPSVVHGDLWSGNVIVGPEGTPCIIDPAVYYGNREVDIAMTQLFGGFDTAFYSKYMEAFPLESGYQERFDIYNLYPLLVHVNLFGLSYWASVERVVAKYV